ncbi:MAG: hypothetical protein ACOC6P_04415 [Candidatus Aminicenantaceae bacterium]
MAYNEIFSLIEKINPEEITFWSGSGISKQYPTDLPTGDLLLELCMNSFMPLGTYDLVNDFFSKGKFKDSYGNIKSLPRLELVIEDIVGVLGYKIFKQRFLTIGEKNLKKEMKKHPISEDFKNLIAGQYMVALGVGKQAVHFCLCSENLSSSFTKTSPQQGIFTSLTSQWWRVYTNGLRDWGKYGKAIKKITEWKKHTTSSFDEFTIRICFFSCCDFDFFLLISSLLNFLINNIKENKRTLSRKCRIKEKRRYFQ